MLGANTPPRYPLNPLLYPTWEKSEKTLGGSISRVFGFLGVCVFLLLSQMRNVTVAEPPKTTLELLTHCK